MSNSTWQTNETEATTVRHIFARFVELGSATNLAQELAESGHHSKDWVSATGKAYIGRLFNKGSLYKLLNNRTYLGEVFYKDQSYPGEHPAIIDHAVWDKAQAIFAINCNERSSITRQQSPAALKGLVFCRQCHRAMTPPTPARTVRGCTVITSAPVLRRTDTAPAPCRSSRRGM